MLDKTYATAQIKRMVQLDYFPSEPAAVNELVAALRVWHTNQAAEDFVTAWLANEQQCPKPATIRNIAFEAQPERGNSCGDCGGLGFVTVKRKGMDFARPCHCHAVNSAS
jgi:hypothetical protein